MSKSTNDSVVRKTYYCPNGCQPRIWLHQPATDPDFELDLECRVCRTDMTTTPLTGGPAERLLYAAKRALQIISSPPESSGQILALIVELETAIALAEKPR